MVKTASVIRKATLKDAQDKDKPMIFWNGTHFQCHSIKYPTEQALEIPPGQLYVVPSWIAVVRTFYPCKHFVEIIFFGQPKDHMYKLNEKETALG